MGWERGRPGRLLVFQINHAAGFHPPSHIEQWNIFRQHILPERGIHECDVERLSE